MTETSIVRDRYAIYHGDTCEHAATLPDDSVDFSIYSPPFASLYVYSASERDMGNVRSQEEFFAHYGFLVREQFRVMKPGCLIAIHCMNLPTSKAHDGYIGLRDFRGEIIREHQKAGFIYHSETVLWKDPVTAMTRTKALGLLWKQLRKDSSMSRQGIPDYLVVMRKPGDRAVPIAHSHEEFPVEQWQRWASPVWASFSDVDSEGFMRCVAPHREDPAGIDPSDTLQASSAREHDDERHIAPLQLEVIRRAVLLWSNPDDVVWSPFLGIGSEGVVSVQLKRRFIGAELKLSYWEQAAKNIAAAADDRQRSIFEVL